MPLQAGRPGTSGKLYVNFQEYTPFFKSIVLQVGGTNRKNLHAFAFSSLKRPEQQPLILNSDIVFTENPAVSGSPFQYIPI